MAKHPQIHLHSRDTAMLVSLANMAFDNEVGISIVLTSKGVTIKVNRTAFVENCPLREALDQMKAKISALTSSEALRLTTKEETPA